MRWCYWQLTGKLGGRIDIGFQLLRKWHRPALSPHSGQVDICQYIIYVIYFYIGITYIYLFSPCSCLCPIHWNQMLSREWRCSWSIADRQLHQSDEQFYCLLRCVIYYRFDGILDLLGLTQIHWSLHHLFDFLKIRQSSFIVLRLGYSIIYIHWDDRS